MKTFYLAQYEETDYESRDLGKQKFCLCNSNGWSRRGIRLDRWFRVLAVNAKDAKARVIAGEGARCS